MMNTGAGHTDRIRGDHRGMRYRVANTFDSCVWQVFGQCYDAESYVGHVAKRRNEKEPFQEFYEIRYQIEVTEGMSRSRTIGALPSFEKAVDWLVESWANGSDSYVNAMFRAWKPPDTEEKEKAMRALFIEQLEEPANAPSE